MSAPRTKSWALLPVKSFARGKSRLGSALGDAARSALARRMFEHVLAITTSVDALAGTLVVTDGDDVAALAIAKGAHVLADPHGASLAQAVDAGLTWLQGHGADAAIVLMADLPELAASDVHAVLDARTRADVVVVTDGSGSFTNALALPLQRGYTTCFGAPGSAARHLARARVLGLGAEILDNARIAFDVDTPDDVLASDRTLPPTRA